MEKRVLVAHGSSWTNVFYHKETKAMVKNIYHCESSVSARLEFDTRLSTEWAFISLTLNTG